MSELPAGSKNAQPELEMEPSLPERQRCPAASNMLQAIFHHRSHVVNIDVVAAAAVVVAAVAYMLLI